jgi:hypothetical protein
MHDTDERRLRIDLAACYRLVALFGWDGLVFSHLSARLPGPDHHFLVCEIQIQAQAGGGELIEVDPRIVAGAKANVQAVTRGMGGGIAWPALLRRLDRIDPGYRS